MSAYKYETHSHTSEVSPCGYITAKDAVSIYKGMGYQGIIITDHFHDEYFSTLEGMDWEKKVDTFLTGYENALMEGLKVGLDVFLGIEIRFNENGNDYLVYGLDVDFLKAHENMFEMTIESFHELVKDMDDVLIIQAHPFRSSCVPVDPKLIDGVEVFNGNPRHDSKDVSAADFALEHNLLISSGSDFHRIGDEAIGGIITDEKITSHEDLINTMRNLNFKSLIISEKASPSLNSLFDK